jgi:hypothetical protein
MYGKMTENVTPFLVRVPHRVGRVLSLFSSRRNWDSPNPSPAGGWATPHPPGSGGRGTLAGERGVGRVLIPTRGHTQWYSLYIRTLWGTPFSKKRSKVCREQKQEQRRLSFSPPTTSPAWITGRRRERTRLSPVQVEVMTVYMLQVTMPT